MTLTQALAEMLRDLIKRKGWSQEQAADHLGVTQSTISHLLNGKRRQDALDHYIKIAQVFDIPLSHLFRKAEHKVKRAETRPAMESTLHQEVAQLRLELEAMRRRLPPPGWQCRHVDPQTKLCCVRELNHDGDHRLWGPDPE